MVLTQIDFYLFTNTISTTSYNDAFAITQSLNSFQLLPQIFHEIDSESNKVEQYSFVNQSSGLGIKISSNHIVFSQKFAPTTNDQHAALDITNACQKLLLFVSSALPELEKIKGKFEFNRLSVITKHIYFEEITLIKNKLIPSFLLTSSTKDFAFRVCNDDVIEAETLNSNTAFYDAVVENTVNNQLFQKKGIMLELDINTMSNNINFRFNATSSQDILEKICHKIEQNINTVNSFVLGDSQ
jgi:hypothetical protein